MSADRVDVTLTVLNRKELPITFKYKNQPSNFDLDKSKIKINPETLDVGATADMLNNLSEVSLGELDLSKLSPDTNTFVMDIMLPDGVRNLSNVTTATVEFDLSDFARPFGRNRQRSYPRHPQGGVMSKPNTSSSGTRILRVLKALRGHALNGVSNGELASALGESPANINRALNTLIEEGLALKLDNGRFAPGVQLLQIAMAHSTEMARAQDRINEINQRVMAGSR